MRIVEVEIKNLCQFRDLRFELHPGLNAIIGPNGSGKSNSLKMLYGSLTNDFSRNEGHKVDNVCQLAGPREGAGVRTVFNHNGVTAEVYRGLRPTRKHLRIAGEEELTKDEAITKRVLGLLGVTEQILSEYVFVDQGDIFSFLALDRTDRAKAFQKLFGTDHAERCWKAAGEVLAAVQIPPPMNLDLVREEVRRCEDLLADAYTDLGVVRRAIVELPDGNERRTLTLWENRCRLQCELKETEGWVAEMDQRRHDLQAEITSFRADRDILAGPLQAGTEAADQAKQALANWRVYRDVSLARERLLRAQENLRGERATRQRPNRSGIYLAADELQAAVTQQQTLAIEVARVRRFLTSFDARTGLTACPECGTPVDSFQDRLRVEANRLRELELDLHTVRSRVEYTRSFDEELRRYDEWHDGWAKRVQQTETQLVALQDVKAPELSEQALRQMVADHAELTKAVAELDVVLAKLDRELLTVLSQATVMEKRVSELRTLVVSIPVTEEEAQRAEGIAAERERLIRERARLEGVAQARETAFREAENHLVRQEHLAREAETARRWVAYLGEVRDVLHRDNLPRIVAHHYLEQITYDVNSFLELFEASFRVSADAELSFVANHFDGRTHSAGRLSWGEKVVLALAFRLSVNSMFAENIGLLCLDEPTFGLDEHNLGCLEIALNRLRELSQARSLQVIMVTHERSLTPLFDRVIELSEFGRY